MYEDYQQAAIPHKVIPIQQGLKPNVFNGEGADSLPHKVIPIQQGLKLK